MERIELINITVNVVIAITTVAAIIFAWKSANKNTKTQIENSNKQSTRPYLSITNCELINSKCENEGLPIRFDNYFAAEINNKLEEKKHVEHGVWIVLTYKNNGYGIARLKKAFDVRKEFPALYVDNLEENINLKRDDYYIDIAVGEEKKVYLEISYIREKPSHSIMEKPISDQCELAFFYTDLNHNFYSNNVVFNILYNYKEASKKENDWYTVEVSQINVNDHYYGRIYETKDSKSHFSIFLNKFNK